MTAGGRTRDASGARRRILDEPLTAEAEERLALLLEELSDGEASTTPERLETLVRAHPDLGPHLRELFAAISVTDAVADRSAVFLPPGSPSHRRPPRDYDPDATITPAPRRSGALPTVAGEAVPGALTLPASFGDYDLLEEIGRGGMGVVYRARQRSLDRVVAVKMLLRRELASASDLARFRSEAEAAAKLDHPGIVSVFEVGERDGHPFYSMQYVEGTTLSRRLDAGPLPPRETAAILAAVAEAVDAAHARGVLHRDLKPSNILIDAEGRPHVSDFGLAKRLGGDDSVTHTGAILGTPCYMSPEQAAGSRGDVGPASDVWSLGAILYQMLTGRPPFQAASPMDTILAVLESDPPLPRSIDRRVDRDLELVALKSLQKPSDLRYASAGALAADLRAFLAGDPVAASRGGLGDVVARLFRETHHAVVLENWGLLWMWHSIVVLVLSVTTDVLAWQGITTQWPYLVLWAGGLALWAPIFWALRHRTGPVTAVERQVAHIWGGAMISSVLLFWVEGLLGLPVLTLSPVLSLVAGGAFFAKAAVLSGAFYIQAAALFATALVMCAFPDCDHIIFGVVSAACFFIPGYKYFRQRRRAD